jgi:hypothetical protein
MILEIIKIDGGLRWNDQDRLFTYSIFETGYEITGNDIGNIELDNQVYVICSNDSSVDGQLFSNINDEIAYIYS